MVPWKESRQPKTFILFLDTGDICRCPMAKGLMTKMMRDRGVEHLEIMTAGVMTTPSILPTAETRLLLTESGIEIGRYRSAQYSEAMIRKADLVLGMSPFHVQKAKRLAPDARDSIHLLKEFSGTDTKNAQIPDPMGATLEVYRRVFREIQDACEKLFEREAVSQPKPVEREAVPTRRTKPGRPLKPTGAGRKISAPSATRALLGVMAAERRAKIAAESIGFPAPESDMMSVNADITSEEAAQRAFAEASPALEAVERESERRRAASRAKLSVPSPTAARDAPPAPVDLEEFEKKHGKVKPTKAKAKAKAAEEKKKEAAPAKAKAKAEPSAAKPKEAAPAKEARKPAAAPKADASKAEAAEKKPASAKKAAPAKAKAEPSADKAKKEPAKAKAEPTKKAKASPSGKSGPASKTRKSAPSKKTKASPSKAKAKTASPSKKPSSGASKKS